MENTATSLSHLKYGLDYTESEARHAYKKVTWRLIPFLFICYVFAYLDRVNIGFAALQMKQDLHFSDATYGLGAGIFFIGYFLFEVPSNLLLQKIGARKTLTRIMVLWGLVSASFAFVQTPIQFYIARFLLGVFEAGFFPGIVLYLTYWYPPAMRGRAIGLFMTAIAVAGIIGGPLSGWILTYMGGANGWAGWQWMFVVEAIPSVILGLLVMTALVDSPKDACWLSMREKELLIHNIEASSEVAQREHSFGKILRDHKVYILGLAYFSIAIGFYAISFWLPTIIRGFGVSSPLEIGILSALPSTAGAVAMVAIARHSDRTAERRWHTALCMIIGGAALTAATMLSGNLALALCTLSIATASLLAAMPVFWTIPTSYLSGSAAAGGIALINSIGLVGGFVSPSVVGWLKTTMGSLDYGLYFAGGVLTVGAILLLLFIPSRLLQISEAN
ncbi:MAG TPA: MFS transporter [Candidatus Sulfotelmatobacter sp.]|nr:MFS transporter [Candidatus Sulfotelmatobacter sp.]